MYIEIDRILVDEHCFPRDAVNWKHIQELVAALKTGENLPPILVGKRGDKYIPLDGRHRYEAHLRLKHTRIGALLTKLPERQWFAEAVRLNTSHGQGLTYKEKLAAAMILRRDNYDPKEIEKIVRIPFADCVAAIEKRGIWKDPEKGLVWFRENAEQIDDAQTLLSGAEAQRLAKELIVILSNDWIATDDDSTIAALDDLCIAVNRWRERNAAVNVA
jgi:hypothetical protein